MKVTRNSISSGIHPLLFMENINNGNRQLGNRSFLQWVGQQYAAGRRNDLRAGAARRLQDAGQPLAAYAPLQFRPKKKKKTGGPAEEAAETLSKTTPEAGAATEPEARVTSAPAQPGATATPEVKEKKKRPHTPQAAAPGQVWVSEKAEAAPVRVSLNKREKELFECCFKGAAGRLKQGSCSVFYYRDAARQLIRIVGIGHHLDQETYRLNYASRPLGKRGHILRLS